MSPVLVDLCWASLALAGVCAVVVIADEVRRPQKMWIMNVVWPITCLYGSVVGLAFYWRVGRLSTKGELMRGKHEGRMAAGKAFPLSVATAATHCGAGCTLGDIIAEPLVAAVPIVLWGKTLFAAYFVDYAFAWTLGIAFQYFTIAPMRSLGVWEGIWAAIKADTLSLTAWQLGMYGWMTIVTLVLVGHEVPKGTPVFWASMQVGMVLGFVTSYPVNWWLLRKGWKEVM